MRLWLHQKSDFEADQQTGPDHPYILSLLYLNFMFDEPVKVFFTGSVKF
jgi:hypothetical protein